MALEQDIYNSIYWLDFIFFSEFQKLKFSEPSMTRAMIAVVVVTFMMGFEF